MSNNTSKQDQLLGEIVSACERARLRSKHPRYAEPIKQQVAGLVRAGVPVAKLSKATGVAQGAIRHWTEVARQRHNPVRILPVEKRELVPTDKQPPLLSIKAGAIEIIIFAPGDHP